MPVEGKGWEILPGTGREGRAEGGEDHESSSALTRNELEMGINTGKRVHISSKESMYVYSRGSSLERRRRDVIYSLRESLARVTETTEETRQRAVDEISRLVGGIFTTRAAWKSNKVCAMSLRPMAA